MPGSRVQLVEASDYKKRLWEVAGEEGGISLPEDLGCRKDFAAEVKATEAERQLDFVISTADVDRDRDIVSPRGLKTSAFKKNPVVLFGHDHRSPPIARALSVEADDRRVVSRAEFTPADLNPFGHMIYRMYLGGYMRAVSIGFIPIKVSRPGEEEQGRAGGVNFEKSELLEYSAVPVPANPQALIQAHAEGIDTAPLKSWAERVLDGEADAEREGLTRGFYERVWRHCASRPTIVHLGEQGEPRYEGEGPPAAPQPGHEPGAEGRAESESEDKVLEVAVAYAEASEDLDCYHCQGATEPGVLVLRETVRGAGHERRERLYHFRCYGEAQERAKTVIGYSQAHSGGTPAAPRDSEWDAAREVRRAEISDLQVMATWRASKRADELTKSDFKLPHHRGEGEHAVVWRGVTAAMAALLGARGGVDIPDSDRRGVYNHLARHYRDDFDEEPPSFEAVEAQVLRTMPKVFAFDEEASGKLTVNLQALEGCDLSAPKRHLTEGEIARVREAHRILGESLETLEGGAAEDEAVELDESEYREVFGEEEKGEEGSEDEIELTEEELEDLAASIAESIDLSAPPADG